MNKNGSANLWHRAERIVAGILFTVFLSLFGASAAYATVNPVFYPSFANKGFLVDPGGGAE